jgi:hypothetical protein
MAPQGIISRQPAFYPLLIIKLIVIYIEKSHVALYTSGTYLKSF